LQLIKVNLIVRHKDGIRWESAGEPTLPVLPRVEEYVALNRRGDIAMYKVVSVIHAVPAEGLTEVFAVYVGTLHEVQDRLLSS
jgi:hypothetical protein